MAVAFGAATEIAAGATASPTTGSHTPSGTPRGVVVDISHEAASDIITGVTYGGVAMTRVLRQEDNLGEFGTVYQYFLGSGIPTGTQTVSISRTNNTTPIQAVVRSFTAGADTELVDTVGANGSGAPTGTGNVANPSVTLSYGGRTCIAVGVMWNGVNAPTSITDGTGLTRDADHDFGASSVVEHHQTTPDTADFTYGNTVATNSYAMVVSAISEVAATTTRMYADDDTSDSLNLPYGASWTNNIGTPPRKRLNPTRTVGTRTGLTGAMPGSASDVDALLGQFVSPALDSAQTIAGNVSMVFLCSETQAADDARFAYILKVLAPNGQLRGALSAQLSSIPTEFGTTASTRIVSSDALTPVDAEAGDRIVLELGVHGNTPAGTGNVTIEVGIDSNADYALTSGLTGVGVGWIEFDSIITFAGANDVFGFGAATKSLSASASGSGTNTPPTGGATGSGAPSKTLSASATGTASQRFVGSGAPSKSLSASAAGVASQRFEGSGTPGTSLSASAAGTATNTPAPVTGSGAVVTSLRASASGVASNPNSPVITNRAVGGGGKRIRFEFVDDEPERPKKKRKKKKRPQPEAVEVIAVEPEPVELPTFEQSTLDPALVLQILRAAQIPQPYEAPQQAPQPVNPLLQGSIEDRLLHHFLQVVGASALPEPDLTHAPHLLVRFLRMRH